MRVLSHHRTRPNFGLWLGLCLASLADGGWLPAVSAYDSVEEGWTIERSDWPERPTASTMVKLDPLPRVYKAYRNQNRKIEIHYPGGRMGRLWASELSTWLVSLGIPSRDIVLKLGSLNPRRLKIILGKKR